MNHVRQKSVIPHKYKFLMARARARPGRRATKGWPGPPKPGPGGGGPPGRGIGSGPGPIWTHTGPRWVHLGLDKRGKSKKTGACSRVKPILGRGNFCLYHSHNTRTVAPMTNTSFPENAVPTRAEIADAALRADIRRLGHQLGDTLIRQHGKGERKAS